MGGLLMDEAVPLSRLKSRLKLNFLRRWSWRAAELIAEFFFTSMLFFKFISIITHPQQPPSMRGNSILHQLINRLPRKQVKWALLVVVFIIEQNYFQLLCDIDIDMTLQLELTKVTGISLNSYVYVEGSQAGPLVSRRLNKQNFLIKCNKNDVLNLTIYDENFKSVDQNTPLGVANVSAVRFLKENRNNADLYNRESPIKFEVGVFDKDDKQAGTLTFNVRYIPGQLYMGEKFAEYETMPVKEPVKLYSGVCQTRNLFNYFDSGYEDKPCSTVENTYRDETWGENS